MSKNSGINVSAGVCWMTKNMHFEIIFDFDAKFIETLCKYFLPMIQGYNGKLRLQILIKKLQNMPFFMNRKRFLK